VEASNEPKEALRLSEERLRLLCRATREIALDWDLKSGDIWWSDQFFSATQYEKGEVKWDTDSWMLRIHSEDRVRVQKRLHEFLSSSGDFWADTYRFLRKDGKYMEMESRGYLQRNHLGEALRMIGTIQRGTEWLAASVQSELKTSMNALSHDLKAPLRHITAFLNLLEQTNREKIDSTGRRYLDLVSAATNNLTRLLEGFLSFLSVGFAPLRPVQTDLNALLSGARMELEKCCESRTLHWLTPSLPTVTGDPVLLREVLVKLLANALESAKKRSVTEIEIGYRKDACETIFSVRDNGIGFDMQHVAKLFHLFQKLHHKSDFDGPGISLACVKAIIERHEGRVWAESVPGTGSTFYFSLPNRP
jgi:light-regulated signal transduction histidine kinase (bacteriophytochrome)